MSNSMKSLFKGYMDYTEEEYKEIWKDAIIVLDTNILLNFFRYSTETRNEIYSIFENIKDRLWIPYQVGLEFFKNKDKVKSNSNDVYKGLISKTKKNFEDLKNEVNANKDKSLKCKKELNDKLEKFSKEIISTLEKEEMEKLKELENNNVENLVIELLNNSIGSQIEEKEFETVKKEGIRRFENKIPPGYKDSDKKENGDYYIFYSMIKHAKENNKNIIFVTDDVKEDWIETVAGNNKGNYQLLNEFYKETGKLLLIYSADGFVRAYTKNNNNNDNNKLNSDTLDELKATRNEKIHQIKHVNNMNISETEIYEIEISEIIHSLEIYSRKFDKEKILKTIQRLLVFLGEMDIFDDEILHLVEKILELLSYQDASDKEYNRRNIRLAIRKLIIKLETKKLMFSAF